MLRERGLDCIPEVSQSESSVSLREISGLSPDVPPFQRSSPILEEIPYSFGNYNTFFSALQSLHLLCPSFLLCLFLSVTGEGMWSPIRLFHPVKMCEGHSP